MSIFLKIEKESYFTSQLNTTALIYFCSLKYVYKTYLHSEVKCINFVSSMTKRFNIN